MMHCYPSSNSLSLLFLAVFFSTETHLECLPQSQMKLLCIKLSTTITFLWHSSSSRKVSIFQFIYVSYSELHTNVASDEPYDLTAMCDHMIINLSSKYIFSYVAWLSSLV